MEVLNYVNQGVLAVELERSVGTKTLSVGQAGALRTLYTYWPPLINAGEMLRLAMGAEERRESTESK